MNESDQERRNLLAEFLSAAKTTEDEGRPGLGHIVGTSTPAEMLGVGLGLEILDAYVYDLLMARQKLDAMEARAAELRETENLAYAAVRSALAHLLALGIERDLLIEAEYWIQYGNVGLGAQQGANIFYFMKYPEVRASLERASPRDVRAPASHWRHTVVALEAPVPAVAPSAPVSPAPEPEPASDQTSCPKPSPAVPHPGTPEPEPES